MTRADKELADAMLERLGIAGLGDRQIRELSGGQQQRVFLARAMISDPVLLLLDEPTSGVDLKTRDEVLHLLADLNSGGMTIVMTTHELNAVAAHLPWVVCVNRRVVAEGDPDHVFTPAILNATYSADLRIVRQDGTVLVADAAPHRLREALRHRHGGYEHAHHDHAVENHVHASADGHPDHRDGTEVQPWNS
jgi:zinc/manganese transport system ATP-binding protein/zinc transport system ATP-binding protein